MIACLDDPEPGDDLTELLAMSVALMAIFNWMTTRRSNT